MPRWKNQRDACEPAIFDALMDAGRYPVRGRDADIFCKHVYGHGMLLECKVPGQERALKPLQRDLAKIFGDRYAVVTCVEDALKAVGIDFSGGQS